MSETAVRISKIFQLQLIHWGIARSTLIKSWPYVAIILAHFIWGTNFVVAKLTLQEFPVMSLAFLRFTLATVLLIPFLLTDKKHLKVDKKDLPQLFAIGVLMVTLNIAFFYEGLVRTTIASASSLTMIIPIASVLTGWWLLKEKVYVVNLVGVVLGLIGAITIIGLPLTLLGAQPTSKALIGNFLVILASISWVAGAILSKKMLEKYSTLTITAIVFFVGMVTFLVPAIAEYIQNPGWPAQLTLLGILGFLFITLAASISAYFLFEWGLGKVGVVKADLFQYLEPLIATSLGIMILNEQPRFSFVAGAILIGLGVYWSTILKDHHQHHKAHRT